MHVLQHENITKKHYKTSELSTGTLNFAVNMISSTPITRSSTTGSEVRKRIGRFRSFHIVILTTIIFALVNIALPLLDLKENPFSSLLQIYKNNTTAKDKCLTNTYDSFCQSIDIISIGTILKSELQLAQHETFGSHPTIRNFYRITELNDTNYKCSTDLTESQFQLVQKICTRKAPNTEYTSKILKLLHHDNGKSSFHARNIGWLCAQKRPTDGLYNVLHPYQSSISTSAKNYTTDDEILRRMNHNRSEPSTRFTKISHHSG